MSVVPIVRDPLNIMCSNRWVRPVMPGRSLAEPTCATQPAATVVSSGFGTSRNVRPFSRVKVSTFTCAEAAGAVAAGAAGAAAAGQATAQAASTASARPAPARRADRAWDGVIGISFDRTAAAERATGRRG